MRQRLDNIAGRLVLTEPGEIFFEETFSELMEEIGGILSVLQEELAVLQTSIKETIAANLARFRIAQGIGQHVLSKKSGVPISSVWRIENKRQGVPSHQMQMRLAGGLEVPFESLAAQRSVDLKDDAENNLILSIEQARIVFGRLLFCLGQAHGVNFLTVSQGAVAAKAGITSAEGLATALSHTSLGLRELNPAAISVVVPVIVSLVHPEVPQTVWQSVSLRRYYQLKRQVFQTTGRAIAVRREELGFSQSKIARALKVSTTMAGVIEKGTQCFLTEELLEKVAVILHTSVQELKESSRGSVQQQEQLVELLRVRLARGQKALKGLRLHYNITQRDLARLIGVNFKNISNLERILLQEQCFIAYLSTIISSLGLSVDEAESLWPSSDLVKIQFSRSSSPVFDRLFRTKPKIFMPVFAQVFDSLTEGEREFLRNLKEERSALNHSIEGRRRILISTAGTTYTKVFLIQGTYLVEKIPKDPHYSREKTVDEVTLVREHLDRLAAKTCISHRGRIIQEYVDVLACEQQPERGFLWTVTEEEGREFILKYCNLFYQIWGREVFDIDLSLFNTGVNAAGDVVNMDTDTVQALYPGAYGDLGYDLFRLIKTIRLGKNLIPEGLVQYYVDRTEGLIEDINYYFHLSAEENEYWAVQREAGQTWGIASFPHPFPLRELASRRGEADRVSSPVEKPLDSRKIMEAMLREDWLFILRGLRACLKSKDPLRLIEFLKVCDQAINEGIQVEEERLHREAGSRAHQMWIIDGKPQGESQDAQDRRLELALEDVRARYNSTPSKAHTAPLESRYPVFKPITLMSRKEEDALVGILQDAVAQDPSLRTVELIEYILLMCGKVHPAWGQENVPFLKGRRIYIFSAEGRKSWKGGLGPVITFVGDALARLLGSFTQIIHIEADYEFARDKSDTLRELHYDPKRMSSRIDDVVRLPEADFTMDWEGTPVRIEVRLGRGTTGALVYLLHHVPHEGQKYYTKIVYDYDAVDNKISWEEFSRFYSLASTRLMAWLEKKAQEEEGLQWKAPVVFANDPQTALVNIYLQESDNSNNALLENVMGELRPTLVAIKQKGLSSFVTHTYKNRRWYDNTLVNRDTIKWLTGIHDDARINKLFLTKYETPEGSKWVLDITSGGLRSAQWRGGVAWKHARDVMRLFNPELDIVGVTNGTDPEWAAKLLREFLQKRAQEAEEVDYDRPTPAQIIAFKEWVKTILFDEMIKEEALVRAYLRWEQEGKPAYDPAAAQRNFEREERVIRQEYVESLKLDPHRPVGGYVGRLVPEKLNMERGWHESVQIPLIRAGMDELILGLLQESDDSKVLRDRLRALQANLKGAKERGDGFLVFLERFSTDVKQAALAALDIIVLDSDEDTEANGFTEVPASMSGALVLSPAYRNGEGLILHQGIRLNCNNPGHGNTLVPLDRSPDAYRAILLKAVTMFWRDKTAFASHQATSCRLSRIFQAILTAAAYANEFNGMFVKRPSDQDTIKQSSSPVENPQEWPHSHKSTRAFMGRSQRPLTAQEFNELNSIITALLQEQIEAGHFLRAPPEECVDEIVALDHAVTTVLTKPEFNPVIQLRLAAQIAIAPVEITRAVEKFCQSHSTAVRPLRITALPAVRNSKFDTILLFPAFSHDRTEILKSIRNLFVMLIAEQLGLGEEEGYILSCLAEDNPLLSIEMACRLCKNFLAVRDHMAAFEEGLNELNYPEEVQGYPEIMRYFRGLKALLIESAALLEKLSERFSYSSTFRADCAHGLFLNAQLWGLIADISNTLAEYCDKMKDETRQIKASHDAIGAYQRAVALSHQALREEGHPPFYWEVLKFQASMYLNLGRIYWEIEEDAKSFNAYQEGKRILEAITQGGLPGLESLYDLAQAHHELARAYGGMRQGSSSEGKVQSEREFHQAIALLRRIITLHRTEPLEDQDLIGRTFLALAANYAFLGQWEILRDMLLEGVTSLDAEHSRPLWDLYAVDINSRGGRSSSPLSPAAGEFLDRFSSTHALKDTLRKIRLEPDANLALIEEIIEEYIEKGQMLKALVWIWVWLYTRGALGDAVIYPACQWSFFVPFFAPSLMFNREFLGAQVFLEEIGKVIIESFAFAHLTHMDVTAQIKNGIIEYRRVEELSCAALRKICTHKGVGSDFAVPSFILDLSALDDICAHTPVEAGNPASKLQWMEEYWLEELNMLLVQGSCIVFYGDPASERQLAILKRFIASAYGYEEITLPKGWGRLIPEEITQRKFKKQLLVRAPLALLRKVQVTPLVVLIGRVGAKVFTMRIHAARLDVFFIRLHNRNPKAYQHLFEVRKNGVFLRQHQTLALKRNEEIIPLPRSLRELSNFPLEDGDVVVFVSQTASSSSPVHRAASSPATENQSGQEDLSFTVDIRGGNIAEGLKGLEENRETTLRSIEKAMEECLISGNNHKAFLLHFFWLYVAGFYGTGVLFPFNDSLNSQEALFVDQVVSFSAESYDDRKKTDIRTAEARALDLVLQIDEKSRISDHLQVRFKHTDKDPEELRAIREGLKRLGLAPGSIGTLVMRGPFARTPMCLRDYAEGKSWFGSLVDQLKIQTVIWYPEGFEDVHIRFLIEEKGFQKERLPASFMRIERSEMNWNQVGVKRAIGAPVAVLVKSKDAAPRQTTEGHTTGVEKPASSDSFDDLLARSGDSKKKPSALTPRPPSLQQLIASRKRKEQEDAAKAGEAPSSKPTPQRAPDTAQTQSHTSAPQGGLSDRANRGFDTRRKKVIKARPETAGERPKFPSKIPFMMQVGTKYWKVAEITCGDLSVFMHEAIMIGMNKGTRITDDSSINILHQQVEIVIIKADKSLQRVSTRVVDDMKWIYLYPGDKVVLRYRAKGASSPFSSVFMIEPVTLIMYLAICPAAGVGFALVLSWARGVFIKRQALHGNCLQRERAARTMGNQGKQRALGILMTMGYDQETSVARAALIAIGKLKYRHQSMREKAEGHLLRFFNNEALPLNMQSAVTQGLQGLWQVETQMEFRQKLDAVKAEETKGLIFPAQKEPGEPLSSQASSSVAPVMTPLSLIRSTFCLARMLGEKGYCARYYTDKHVIIIYSLLLGCLGGALAMLVAKIMHLQGSMMQMGILLFTGVAWGIAVLVTHTLSHVIVTACFDKRYLRISPLQRAVLVVAGPGSNIMIMAFLRILNDHTTDPFFKGIFISGIAVYGVETLLALGTTDGPTLLSLIGEIVRGLEKRKTARASMERTPDASSPVEEGFSVDEDFLEEPLQGHVMDAFYSLGWLGDYASIHIAE
ncbi:MAG: helix-turn-helix domain-containing protein, partial [Candidatus Omnitrophica bacterium]|nr:helix-turn-helix domain-containing protein [Candidatus Omnitrophota bacterium]